MDGMVSAGPLVQAARRPSRRAEPRTAYGVKLPVRLTPEYVE